MSRAVTAWDTETCLIRPGKHAPELVCLSWAHQGDSGLVHHTDARPLFKRMLRSGHVLVGHNVAYDMGVMGAAFPDLVPEIFAVYDADLVTDTMIRQKLLDIASGTYRGKLDGDEWVKINYHLSDIVRRWTGRFMVKDGWRMYYGEFRDTPLADWPRHALTVQAKFRPDFEALQAEQKANPKAFSKKQLLADLRELVNSPPEGVVTYPLGDAAGTLDGYLGQEAHAEPYLRDQFRACRKDFWLHLMSTWGLRTSHAGVARLRTEAEALHAEVKERLVATGLVRPNGTRDTKAAKAFMESVCIGQGLLLRKTKPTESNPEGGTALDEDACKATDDPVLLDYARFSKLSKVLTNDVKALALGTVFPIHTHFGMAETGRTTSSNPNVQNWGRKGGARECFTPRHGYVYASCDVDQLELRTLSQVCIRILGTSELGRVINSGKDPHTMLACSMMGVPYERGLELKEQGPGYGAEADLFDDYRQTAKVANFGLPGGLGAAKLVLFARKSYGVDLGKGNGEVAAINAAKDLKARWLQQWPEMSDYFRYVSGLTTDGKHYNQVQLFSERYRGGAKYTAACNGFFQGLGADATGRGGWYVARACYAEPSSPVFGCRPVNYVHDDILMEVAEDDRASDAANEMARLFVKGINELLPDVPATATPLLTRVMSKKAKRVIGQDGRLKVWEPKTA